MILSVVGSVSSRFNPADFLKDTPNVNHTLPDRGPFCNRVRALNLLSGLCEDMLLRIIVK